MATRTQRKTVAFGHPFRLKGVDRVLPPGDYEVLTDEELIEGLSFPVYHRVSTAIIVPAQSHQASSVEMVAIDPRDLQAAQDRDASALQPPAAKSPPHHGRENSPGGRSLPLGLFSCLLSRRQSSTMSAMLTAPIRTAGREGCPT
jgi:hypothetical protein